MNVLLDTCTFLWVISDPPRISALARQLLANPLNYFLLSVVSEWEIALKYSTNRLTLLQPPATLIPASRALHGIDLLILSEEAVFHLPNLPRHHKDPFDRMLVCQASVHQLTILTPDPLIRQYSVPTIW